MLLVKVVSDDLLAYRVLTSEIASLQPLAHNLGSALRFAMYSSLPQQTRSIFD